MSEMLRVKEVATRLNLCAAKVYELIEQRRLPHFRFGGAIRVSEEQLCEYIQGCAVEVQGEQPRVARPKLKHIKLSAVPRQATASD